MKDKVVGKVKEETGKLTGNEELEIKGKIQQGVGKAREVVEDVKDNVLDKANDIVDDMTDKE
ncbi:MAG: CsbD family protein [Erysipelothrix sp.]|nr:CsbD family protein [Erysipelothrix sp.]